jgi:3-oxoacyl-[acyl-carrier-protein] synthase II
VIAPLRQVWITGIDLISSLARGPDDHWQRLHEKPSPIVAPCQDTGLLVHPLPPLDFSAEIPNAMDRKRMGLVQALGVHTAGRALASAGLRGRSEVLDRALVVVGCAGGERDQSLDDMILAEPARFSDAVLMNNTLATRTRPSLFLSQLPNLLAGNISILLGVTGGSRTVMGEELAGVNAANIAYQLVADGTYEVALVGAAFNAERLDLLLLYGSGNYLWPHGYKPVRARAALGGGYILGSMAAFLVLESADHARARGANPWCRLDGLVASQADRAAGGICAALDEAFATLAPLDTKGGVAIITGASGASPSTAEEIGALSPIASRRSDAPVWDSASIFGHGMEASFLFNLGLGVLALRHRLIYPPHWEAPVRADRRDIGRLLVTGVGHASGEAVAALSSVDGN